MVAHTRSLSLPPSGQKDISPAQACCHQRLAEQAALLLPLCQCHLQGPPLALALCLSLQSTPIPAKTRSWHLPRGQAHPRHFLEEHLDFWRSKGAVSASRGAESWLASPAQPLSTTAPSETPWAPQGFPGALRADSQQLPRGFLTPSAVFTVTYSALHKHVFLRHGRRVLMCFCFYFPPLLPFSEAIRCTNKLPIGG